MNAFDFAPLFRSAIGFDRLARLMDTVSTTADASYPPYNIERTGEESYCLTMAVAGFGTDDIELTVKENTLTVTGRAGGNDARKSEVLYRGIAGRAFERRFVLADHIVVESADLLNGLLNVNLRRVVPEALKPRRVPVNAGAPLLAGAGSNDAGTANRAA